MSMTTGQIGMLEKLIAANEEQEAEIGELTNEVSALKMQLAEVDADAVTFKAELAALRAVAVAVRNADWYDVEPGMEVTKTICLNSSRWEYIMELVEVAETAGYLPAAQAEGVS